MLALLRCYLLLVPTGLYLNEKLPKLAEFVFPLFYQGPPVGPWADEVPMLESAMDVCVYLMLGVVLSKLATPDAPSDPNPDHSPGQEK